MTASVASRRALLCGIAALPGLSGAALASPNPDPHLAHAAAALPLWREHKATEWGWGEPPESPADLAALAAHRALMEHQAAALELPLPTTLAGLRAAASVCALAYEGWFHVESDDLADRSFAYLLKAILRATQAELPGDFRGVMCREGQVCA